MTGRWQIVAVSMASLAATAGAGTLRGQYLEARSCDIYTGPCFANAEIGLAGREAVVAWKVDGGDWRGTSLDGLCAAVVLKADNTLGDDGVFPMAAEGIESVILIDERATADQRQALEGFVRESASRYTANVQHVRSVPMSLTSDHDRGQGEFTAGTVAAVRTRAMGKLDCVCSNEMVFYQPLTAVHFAAPVYALTQSYHGDGLNSRWTLNSTRSAFLGTFKAE